MKTVLVNIILLYLSTTAYTQVYSSYSITKDTLEIGDQINLVYKATTSDPLIIKSIDFTSLDTLKSKVDLSTFVNIGEPTEIGIADIDIGAEFKKFSNNTLSKNDIHFVKNGNQFEYIDTFILTFWDMGYFVIPHPEIKLDSSLLTKETLELQSPQILVTPTLSVTNTDTTQVILGIKDIMRTPFSWKDYLWYFMIPIFLLLLIAAIIFVFLNKKKKAKKPIVIEKPLDPAHIIALDKLKLIKDEEKWKIGLVKEYQSTLTYTIREYLENRFGIQALEQTTNQIQSALKKHEISSTQVSTVSDILQIADLVKFAKAKPSEDINATFLDKAFEFVEETKTDITVDEIKTKTSGNG